MHERIATTSIGEGLDFACNLVSGPVALLADSKPELATELLRTLAAYNGLRYAGEDELAFEYLEFLGKDVAQINSFPKDQFWSQMAWLAKQMNRPIADSK